MVLLLKKIWHGYSYLLNEVADPRTKDWPLVGNPSYGLSILLIYLAFVTKCGPCWMNRRQPYNVDRIVIIYNVIQVLTCTYVFGEGLWYAWGWDYRWICEPLDTSNNYKALKVAEFVYHYYLLKYLDLFDTVFFILRKKYNQASFLHLFHHFNVVIMAWSVVAFVPGGHGTLVLIINTFIHIVMYTYYLLTIADPSVKQSIWWKKHITQLQIVQLVWCAFHMTTPLFKSDCNYPIITALFVPSDLFVLALFLDFYYRAYIKTPVRKPDKKEIDDKDTKSVTNEEDSIKGYDVISKGELNQDVQFKSYGGVLQKSVLSHRANISNKEP